MSRSRHDMPTDLLPHDDVVERCRELTGGPEVDYAYDDIGATAPASLRALRPRGRRVWFGMVTFLSQGGTRDWRKTAKMLGNVALAFAGSLRPGGKRTSLYTVLSLDEVPAALANPAGHGPPGKQVIFVAPSDQA